MSPPHQSKAKDAEKKTLAYLRCVFTDWPKVKKFYQ